MPAAKFSHTDTPNPSGGLTRSGLDYHFTFHAMATPCEVRIETDDFHLASKIGGLVEAEARRIEQKFSRYRAGSVVGQINASGGAPVTVDAETCHLLNFADQCHDISDGLFDITSGVLRKIWRFDGSDRIPDDDTVAATRKHVGWKKALWKPPVITLPAGMEIDLGGLGKEYAVDKAVEAACAITKAPVLVNFGGDLRVSGPRETGARWKVAIESVDNAGELAAMLELVTGALATSGDSRRFLVKDGIRYGHILNPHTGKPVKQTPRSVTVAAPTCIEAGMFATLAMLKGRNAEKFLKREGLRAWCIR